MRRLRLSVIPEQKVPDESASPAAKRRRVTGVSADERAVPLGLVASASRGAHRRSTSASALLRSPASSSEQLSEKAREVPASDEHESRLNHGAFRHRGSLSANASPRSSSAQPPGKSSSHEDAGVPILPSSVTDEVAMKGGRMTSEEAAEVG